MNRKIRVLIVDDESLARKALLMMLNKDPQVEVIGECRNGREAVTMIREQSPDIVFLDIQMPGKDGFQVIEEVGTERMPVTVFVTAYDKYALQAFEAHALDYLLKPFDQDRFNNTLLRAKTSIRQRKLDKMSESLFAVVNDMKSTTGEPSFQDDNRNPATSDTYEPIDRVTIKSGGRIYFLKVEEIDWVEGAGDYLSIHAGSQSHLIRESMGNFYAKLDPKKFLRIHRSAIVKIECIKDIRPLFKGEYDITLTNGKRLNSSKSYRHHLQKLLDDAR